jgi:hypothetical protein
VKGVEVLTSTVYLLHELDEGANLIRQKKLAASNGENICYHSAVPAFETKFVHAVSGRSLLWTCCHWHSGHTIYQTIAF